MCRELVLARTMPETCLACHKSFHGEEQYLLCCECNFHYHVGNCSGVSLSAYRKKTDATIKTWKCATCKTTKPRGSHNTTNFNDETEVDLSREINEIHRKLAVLIEMKVKVDALDEIKATVDSVEQAVQEMAKKYDEVISQMKQQNADITGLKKRVEKLEVKVNDFEIGKLKQELNDLDQYSRRLNLEIHGMPYHAGENLLDKLNRLADDLDVPHLSDQDVEAVHRLPPKRKTDNASKTETVPPILVRFFSRKIRDSWLAKKSELRKTKSKIFLNENLTAQNKQLFWKMKTRAVEREYQFVWHKSGKLFVRRSPRDRVIRIITMDDLEKIK